MLENRIRKYLSINNMNKRDLANKIGVKESLLSRWLKDDKITASFLYKLVELWPDVDLNYLVKGEDNSEYKLEDNTLQVGEDNFQKHIRFHTNEIEKHLEEIKKLTL